MNSKIKYLIRYFTLKNLNHLSQKIFIIHKLLNFNFFKLYLYFFIFLKLLLSTFIMILYIDFIFLNFFYKYWFSKFYFLSFLLYFY